MPSTHAQPALRFFGLAAFLILGCSDAAKPTSPVTGTGAIKVTVSTSGVVNDFDPDGYLVIVDGTVLLPIGLNTAVTIANLSLGKHYVRLEGLAANCSHGEASARPVDVIAIAGESPVTFGVVCTSKGGEGPDPWGY